MASSLSSRNFFAHSLPEIIDTANVTLFKNALETALKLVDSLIELNIAPSVIYITAHGWDEYGRGTVWFVDERYVNMNPNERYTKELRMFKPAPDEFEKLKPYMTVTWPKDQMFDPPLAPFHLGGGTLPDEAV